MAEIDLQTVDKALLRFRQERSAENAEYADYVLSKLRLMLGERFDSLHYYVSAHREVVDFLENERRKTNG